MFREVKTLYLCVLGKLGNILYYTTHEKIKASVKYKRCNTKLSLTTLDRQ